MCEEEQTKKTLLLVEDQPIIALAESESLKEMGYEVISATKGEEAVALIRERTPVNLILMDIDLGPGIDGTEAARQILQIKNIPIVFLTSHSEKEMVDKVRGITRYGYIIKNSGNFVLQSSIEMAFELFEANVRTRENEDRHRGLIHAIPDLVWLKDVNGAYLSCNRKFEEFFGALEKDILGKTDYDFVDKELADSFVIQDRKAMETGETLKNEKWLSFAETGYRGLFETVKTPLWNSDGETIGVLGIARDITSHRRAEEALSKRILALSQPSENIENLRFTDLFNKEDIQKIQDSFAEAMKVASIITDPDGNPITEPSRFCPLCKDIIRNTEKGRINCFRSDAAIGKLNHDGPTVQPCLSGGLWDAGASITVGGKHIASWLIGQVRSSEIDEERMLQYAETIGADKEAYRKALLDVPVMPVKQFTKIALLLHMIANEISLKAYQNIQQARIITEKKEIEKNLIQSNKDKEVLLREMQHRMKNTLGIVSGLLNLEIGKFQTDGIQSALKNSIARIESIGSMYEQLYTQNSANMVELSEYIRNTGTKLAKIYSTEPELIEIAYSLEPMRINIREAVNIGLITTELITNSLKYAFTPGEKGRISISLRRITGEPGEMLELKVSDTGHGDSRRENPDEQHTGIGLELVRLIAEQMNGSIDTNAEGRFTATLLVPFAKK